MINYSTGIRLNGSTKEHKKSPDSPCILLRWIFRPGSGSLEQVPARGGLEAVVDGAGGRGPEADVDH